MRVREPNRYDRWVSLLPGGAIPNDGQLVHWAKTWPPLAPLLGGYGAKWSHLPKEGPPKGLLFQAGLKKGAVTIWLSSKGGKVHVAANPAEREVLLEKILAWTEPFNNGRPPVAPRGDALPPLPAQM